MSRFSVRALTVAFLSATAASSVVAQEPTADDFRRKFAPPPGLTRSIVPPKTRNIVVEPREPIEVVIQKLKPQPSLNVRVLFEYDSDRLTPQGVEALKPFGTALQDPQLKDVHFLVGGHTDATGSDSYNDDLSGRRARSAIDHVIAVYRVDPSRLQSRGFGKRSLADPQNPTSPANRRVEIISLTQFAQQ